MEHRDLNETQGWGGGLDAWLRRPVAIVAWSVALLIGGGWAATEVPLEWVPTVELPRVRISASWPGASPRSVERYVTAPIERAAGQVEGTAHIESLSEEGRATVTLEVAETADLGPYVAQVNEQLALLRETLPERVVPHLTKEIPEALRDEQGFMTLQLVGPQPPGMLRRVADEQIAPKLQSLNGVADVVVRGGTRDELLITLDPGALAVYGIQPSRVRQHLATATRDAVYGRLRQRGHATLLLSPAEGQVEALRRLVLTDSAGHPPVRLADVARVQRGPAPRRSISRINGEPVVTLTLDRAPASHMLEVARRVEARAQALRASLPSETRLLIADDKSAEVRSQLRDLAWRGGLGLVLLLLVLLLMLRSVRAVAVVVFSVAVALAVAIGLMGPLGLTLNLLTLGGLVLVLGLLVDNSVVMTEQLIVWRARGRRRAGVKSADAWAAGQSLRAVGLPLVGGTLTTMVVMGPLVYLSGELRALFLPFGVLTALTLAVSLGSAALLVPVLARFLPPPASEPRRTPRWMRAVLQAPYRWAARVPKITLIALLLLLGTPLWLMPEEITPPDEGGAQPVERLAGLYNTTLGSDAISEVREWLDPALGGVIRPFIQETTFGEGWDFNVRPEAYVRLGFPPGNPITRADSLVQRFEQTALASASVRQTIARVSERSASLRVQFHEAALETAEPYLVREELIQEAVLLAGITVSVGGLLPQGYYSGSGANISGFTLEAFGPNYEELEALAERLARRLKGASRRVATVNTNAGRFGNQRPRQVLRFRWDADAQVHTRVSANRVAARLRPVLTTRFPALYADLDGTPRVPVRLVVEGADETDVATLVDQPLPVGDTTAIKLNTAATYAVAEVPSRIERANQQYKRYIRVDYRGPYRMGNTFLEEQLAQFAVPTGYRLERATTTFFEGETKQAFGWIVLGTIVLVFLVTAMVFESWRLPLVVLLSVPTAAIGIALGFLWSGVNFAEGAFIGTVLLVGIAANDSILLADRFQQLRAARPHGRAGVLARLAVRERLRPMWTTTLSTIVAMLPLLVFPQEGDFWLGLAVTVTGGLLAATLLAPMASVALVILGERPSGKRGKSRVAEKK